MLEKATVPRKGPKSFLRNFMRIEKFPIAVALILTFGKRDIDGIGLVDIKSYIINTVSDSR